MITEKIITDFGYPKFLEKIKPEFIFDDKFSEEDSPFRGCHCKSDSVKFHLYSQVSNESIFTMDFYIRTDKRRPAFGGPFISKPHIRLQYIGTSPTFMDKGLATFYLKKLHDFAATNGLGVITINVAPSGKKGPNKEQLFDFYNSFTSDKVKIEPF